MDIKVFDAQLNYLGILDKVNSFTYKQYYNKVGSFCIKGVPTNQVRELVKVGNLIYFEGRAGFIQSVQIDLDAKKESLVVNGGDLLELLERRIVWSRKDFTGALDVLFTQLFNENIIKPADAKRALPGFSFINSSGVKPQVEKLIEIGTLLPVVLDLCVENELGIRLNFNPATKGFALEIYKGRDKTSSTEEPIIFNREYDNLFKETYIDSVKGFSNVALVGGEDTGKTRVFVEVGTGEGFGRFESFIGATESRDGMKLPKYNKVLTQKGLEALRSAERITSLEGQGVAQNAQLGDKITLIDRELGISIDDRITGIEEIYQGSKVSKTLTFGNMGGLTF